MPVGMDLLSVAFLFFVLAPILGRWPTPFETSVLSLYILVRVENLVPHLQALESPGPSKQPPPAQPHLSPCPTKTHPCPPSRSHRGKETQCRLKGSPLSCGQNHN